MSYRSSGAGGDDKKTSMLHTNRAPIDTSHFLTSGSAPSYSVKTTTKTVDIQTDEHDLDDRFNGAMHPLSAQSTLSSVKTPQLTVQQQIARYIESEMKEKYMEQARTLEQIQVQMKQEFLDKQAQLMEHLHRLDIQPGAMNGNTSSAHGSSMTSPTDNHPGLNGTSNNNNGMNKSTQALPTSANTAITTSTSTSGMSKTVLTKSAPVNGHSIYHNGKNGTPEAHEVTNTMTSSFSADESINGNTSQGSSHDTWDSTNAFTHERPVLTGSERSTPTPVLPSFDSTNDLELLSQSIHIPVDVKDLDLHKLSNTSTPAGLTSEVKPTPLLFGTSNRPSNGDLIDLATPVSEPTADNTPRNTTSADPVATAATMIGPPTTSSPPPHSNDGRRGHTLESPPSEDEDFLHSNTYSSTPPPESPADDLSASLRFSLRQKHSRHLADMKAYYERELSDLKEKLTSSFAITQQETYEGLENENERLRERCRILEEELLRANRYINSVDKQMEDLESSFNASLAASSKTPAQPALDDSTNEQLFKSKLTQAESYIQRLETKNKDLFSALCDAYEVRDNTARTASQGNLLYDELKEKYEELKTSNGLTMVKLQSTENSLRESQQDMDSLKKSIRRLEIEHQKLAKENEVLRLTTATPVRDGSFTLLQSDTDEQTMSPMLRAERQLSKSSKQGSPSNHRSRHHHHHHHYHTDKSRHHTKQQSTDQITTNHKAASHVTDLNPQLSPQLLSDATQSSDNSKEHIKQHNKTSSKRSTAHRPSLSTEHRLSAEPSATSQTFYKDDLISAYSPIVDRQRHSSSASSSGPAIKSATSPSRQSIDRPYGFHHVGASVSPSKRTQQWAVLSPFNRTVDLAKQDKNIQPSPLSAKKNLSFALSKSASTSPQKTKINKDDILEKVRAGHVFSEDQDISLSPAAVCTSAKKATSAYQNKLQLIQDAETRLDELLAEKKQLESSLTRMSTTYNRKDKHRQENIEQQLDKVDKDLGSVRMTLRRYNVL